MGQAHRIVNLTRAEQYGPGDTGEGEKLMEFGHDGAGAAGALLLLLASTWGGDRVAVVGDYGSPEDIAPEIIAETGFDGTCYDHPDLAPIGSRVRSMLNARGLATFTEKEAFGRTCTVRHVNHDVQDAAENIVVWNLDVNEYLDPADLGDSRNLNYAAARGGLGGTTTALTALLAATSNHIGGELRSTSPLVGSWAGARLLTTSAHPLPDFAHNITPAVRDMLAAAGEGAYDVAYDGFVIRDDPFKKNRTFR